MAPNPGSVEHAAPPLTGEAVPFPPPSIEHLWMIGSVVMLALDEHSPGRGRADAFDARPDLRGSRGGATERELRRRIERLDQLARRQPARNAARRVGLA
jgi:hypothetical protein